MPVMGLHEMRERLSHVPGDRTSLRMPGKRPGDRGRPGAPEGARVAPQGGTSGADHERRAMDRGRAPKPPAPEPAETTTSYASAADAAGKARVRGDKCSARQGEDSQTSKFSHRCGLPCGTKSRRITFRPRNRP